MDPPWAAAFSRPHPPWAPQRAAGGSLLQLSEPLLPSYSSPFTDCGVCRALSLVFFSFLFLTAAIQWFSSFLKYILIEVLLLLVMAQFWPAVGLFWSLLTLAVPDMEASPCQLLLLRKINKKINRPFFCSVYLGGVYKYTYEGICMYFSREDKFLGLDSLPESCRKSNKKKETSGFYIQKCLSPSYFLHIQYEALNGQYFTGS